MPFSLALYLYKRIQEKAQKEFEKNNRILYWKDLEGLAAQADKERVVEILKSAVLTHGPVDGVPYYLMPPLAPAFAHDYFKRCLIADVLGGFAGSLTDDASRDAVDALTRLSCPSSAGYVRIFAYHALGRWAQVMPEVFDECRDGLIRNFAGPTAGLLGAFVFLDKISSGGGGRQARAVLEEGAPLVLYKVQKALLYYFLGKSARYGSLPGRLKAPDEDTRVFLDRCKTRGFMLPHHFEEGAREIGLMSLNQKGGLQAGTQQAEVGRRLKAICNEYVSAAGFFINEIWR